MLPGQKEEAEVLRHGLMAGCRTVADAVAWADNVIAADPQPDSAVIEVATSSGRRPADVSALLRDVRGECDSVTAIRRSMADLRDALTADPARGPHIARWLYELATSGELPDADFGSDAYALEDWFALASEGIETYEGAVEELQGFLRRHERR